MTVKDLLTCMYSCQLIEKKFPIKYDMTYLE